MVLCPVALAVGCRKCPVFAVCPLKSVIGDQAPTDVTPPRAQAAAPKSTTKVAGKGKTAKSAAKASSGETKRHSRRRDD